MHVFYLRFMTPIYLFSYIIGDSFVSTVTNPSFSRHKKGSASLSMRKRRSSEL